VNQLAEREYRQGLFPVASAVRALIHGALDGITRDVRDLPMYEREIKFLRNYIDGWTVTEISNDLGFPLEHVSRTVRTSALTLLVRGFFHQLGI